MMNPEYMKKVTDMAMDPQDSYNETKIEAQDKKDEWVDEKVTEQILLSDIAGELLVVLENIASNPKIRNIFIQESLKGLRNIRYSIASEIMGGKLIDYILEELKAKYEKQYDEDHKNDQ